MEGESIGVLVSWRVQKCDHTLLLLKWNINAMPIKDFDDIFKAYRCPTFEKIFTKKFACQRHLMGCSELLEHFYAINVCQIGTILCVVKVYSFRTEYRSQKMLFQDIDFMTITWFACKIRASKTRVQLEMIGRTK